MIRIFLIIFALFPQFLFAKGPLEKCMDLVINYSFSGNEKYAYEAAKYCKGVTNESLICMDRVINGSFSGNKKMYANVTSVCIHKEK